MKADDSGSRQREEVWQRAALRSIITPVLVITKYGHRGLKCSVEHANGIVTTTSNTIDSECMYIRWKA